MASLHACIFTLFWAPILLNCINIAAVSVTSSFSPSSSSSAAAAAAAAATSTSRFSIINTYPSIFVFGDSLSDTGNRAISTRDGPFKTTQFPYGETFPGWPTGRFSDGRTVVDFLATYMELPLLNPYLNSSADFGGGVNYAVGGATALNASFLNSLSIYPSSNLSLDVQLSWHLAFKTSVESSNGLQSGSPTPAAFEEGLYVIEIGGNDYIFAYYANYSCSFVNSTLMPLVIEKMHNAVETLLNYGAKNFLFVSNTPLGCAPSMLARFEGVKDINGCLEEHNLASYLHGVHVQGEVTKLRTLYPNATFLFMDYYGAYTYVLKQKETFGFEEDLKACCGAGDGYAYNYNPRDECNIDSISICSDPNKYIIWDGIHMTESFNFQIFNQTFVIGSYLDNVHSLL